MKEMMNEEMEEGSPLDSIIARVASYKEDPKLVTPETLAELEEELMDLKSYMDGDEEMEEGHKGSGLTVILGSQK